MLHSIGLCTHFTETDEWAFEYALQLARTGDRKLTICHWLHSPYRLRRDIVDNDLFAPTGTVAISPRILAGLELQLREHYEPKLGDFTNVGFKLCAGLYQVELVRCFRQHLLDMVVMGYSPGAAEPQTGEQSMLEFARTLDYPVVIVGGAGPQSYWLNAPSRTHLQELNLAEGDWQELPTQAIEALA